MDGTLREYTKVNTMVIGSKNPNIVVMRNLTGK